MVQYSVVIPLYNKERHIKRAIDSVLKQTKMDFELIIVDDGSTDNSFNVARQCQDSRIRLIRQDNAGVSAARNKGILESRTKYIGFLDADDAWKPDFLASISGLIKKFPAAGAFAASYEICRGTEIVAPALSGRKMKGNWEGMIGDYFELSMRSPLFHASSVVIAKHVFEKIGGFATELVRGEDLDMWCRIALNYNIAYLNKVCATYFIDSDNRSDKVKPYLRQTFSNKAERILLDGKAAGNKSFYFEEYMINKIINTARLSIYKGKRIEAIKLLYKYRFTRYNRRYLLKTLIKCFIPVFMFDAFKGKKHWW